uniref:Putative plant transposon protein domain-containing protein n=1 Tax=Solanum tuberosum TaxID=4113 RepID=M1E0V4_SOLTU
MSATAPRRGLVASSNNKRLRTCTTIPPAPAVPRGQTQRYGAKAVTSKGKKWYKSHTEAKYFSDVILDDVNLERELPPIMHRLQELHMGFIFQDPSECNVSVVREFYANWKPDARSHFVTVRGVEVPLTPSAINQILGTADAPFDVLMEINISPPYQQIRHALCGAVVHCEMDLAWALWLSPVISLCSHESGSSGAVLKLAMRKAIVHRGRRYAFGGLIINLCRRAGVPKESVDYMAPLFTTPLDVTKTKGLENMHGPTLITAERNRRDDMITARMFGLEMLCPRNGCLASSQEQLDEITTKYPLNEHAETLLGLGPTFLEPV